jgi:ABC-type xylose transport system substrate-binding protein
LLDKTLGQLNGNKVLNKNKSDILHFWLTPDDNNNTVLIKGTAKGSKGVIPSGGQKPPISIAGDKLEWKNAQKILKKAKASLIIKRTIP